VSVPEGAGTRLNELDCTRLEDALALAHQAIGLSDPNPRVGCVIGTADGTILGRGHTQRAGEAHAEAAALRHAGSLGHDVRGATAWVTLEPCAHQGRTPPCCDALIDAGLARVVVAMTDPNPLVLGQGIHRLRAAGITVDMASDSIAQRAAELNVGFISRHTRGRPWVRLKLAQSIDGRNALLDGTSQWITGPEARADGHAWRKRAGAVVTGIGTVLADDPRMDVRLVPTVLQPLRVVVDSRWRTPTSARVLEEPGRVLVAGLMEGRDAASGRFAGRAEVSGMPCVAGGPPRVDLVALVQMLFDRQVHELHVEAGGVLAGSFMRLGLVDELLAYLAPVFVGPGLAAVELPQATALKHLDRWSSVDLSPVGADIRWRLRRADGQKNG
jgi:diaminohydroxyphosphoribosylaminopyrimidine deaminase / 5-amino-6-(5-phosphoribosylamino)uracil reductase